MEAIPLPGDEDVPLRPEGADTRFVDACNSSGSKPRRYALPNNLLRSADAIGALLLLEAWCRGSAGQVPLSGVGRCDGIAMMAAAPLAIEFRLDGIDCIVCGRRAIALIPKHGIRHRDSCCRLPPTPPPLGARKPSRRPDFLCTG